MWRFLLLEKYLYQRSEMVTEGLDTKEIDSLIDALCATQSTAKQLIYFSFTLMNLCKLVFYNKLYIENQLTNQKAAFLAVCLLVNWWETKRSLASF